jgi:L-cysteine S-thiosulfotransferase
MNLPPIPLILLATLAWALPAAAQDVRSGYDYASPQTKATQDDAFANPGALWLEEGRALWRRVEGKAGKSCADCHSGNGQDLVEAGAAYPKFDAELGRPITLSRRIRQCRTTHMKAADLAPESNALMSLEMLLRHRSVGKPLGIAIDGPMRPFFERGKALYFQRRGQFNMACNHCHDQRPGKYVRGERLSQGQINNFPAYLVRWGKVGSAHRRFQLCDRQARAKPYPIESPEYVALEIYVAHRGRGLPVEAPAVRP